MDQEQAWLRVGPSSQNKFILDSGQNLVGRLRVRVTGAPGHVVTFQHVEVPENGESTTRPLRHAAANDTLILSGDEIIWEPRYTIYGSQFVEVTNWPSSDDLPKSEDIVARVLHTDTERTG
ncbi:hypothetical protein PENSUB_9835 [Penicillium subrubescens]|nr:hypothetical protein PENSUB_9835 [Penicillium subrubescens]